MEENEANPYAPPQTSVVAVPLWTVKFIPGATWWQEGLRTSFWAALFSAGYRILMAGSHFYSSWAANLGMCMAIPFSAIWVAMFNRNAARKVKANPPTLRDRPSRVGGPAWGSLEGKHRPGSLWLTDEEMIFIPKDTRLGKVFVVQLRFVSGVRTRPWLGLHLPTTLLVSMSTGQKLGFTVSRPRRWKEEITAISAKAVAAKAASNAEIKPATASPADPVATRL